VPHAVQMGPRVTAAPATFTAAAVPAKRAVHVLRVVRGVPRRVAADTHEAHALYHQA
jgi:hypothetical protein